MVNKEHDNSKRLGANWFKPMVAIDPRFHILNIVESDVCMQVGSNTHGSRQKRVRIYQFDTMRLVSWFKHSWIKTKKSKNLPI